MGLPCRRCADGHTCNSRRRCGHAPPAALNRPPSSIFILLRFPSILAPKCRVRSWASTQLRLGASFSTPRRALLRQPRSPSRRHVRLSLVLCEASPACGAVCGWCFFAGMSGGTTSPVGGAVCGNLCGGGAMTMTGFGRVRIAEGMRRLWVVGALAVCAQVCLGALRCCGDTRLRGEARPCNVAETVAAICAALCGRRRLVPSCSVWAEIAPELTKSARFAPEVAKFSRNWSSSLENRKTCRILDEITAELANIARINRREAEFRGRAGV